MEDQIKTPQEITAAIHAYINGHANKTIEWTNFKRCQQQVGESVSNYLIALCKLLKTYKFCLDACAHKG